LNQFLTQDGGSDIYINQYDRNRALNDDIVAIEIKKKFNWNIIETCRNDVNLNFHYYYYYKKKINFNFYFNYKVLKQLEKYKTENKIEDLTTSTSNLQISNDTKSDQNSTAVANSNNLLKNNLQLLAPSYHTNDEFLKLFNDNWFQKQARVVNIIEQRNKRLAVGHLKLFSDKNKDYALFSPNDSRMPRIKVRINDCPPDFYVDPNKYAKTLFIVKLTEIPVNSTYGLGEIYKIVGRDDEIESATEGILIENGVDFEEFPDDIKESLPSIPWSIPNEEFQYRRDLRNHCIFTIDPEKARDLDDALHCVQLSEDLFEVGVHIADVSHFVRENSLIDKIAVKRTTSVYLVNKVIPMLPRLLCEELCSLNPAEDRLTFSVIWKINKSGDVILIK
jgi:DIS3-like exonuclease 2